LASILVEDFERQWRSPVSRSVRQYLREILPTHISISSTAKDITRVAHHLAMPEDLVKNHLQVKPPKVFLLGRPGSGKTTVVQAIQETVKSAGASGTVKWLSDATYLWRVFRASGAGDESVEPTEDGGFFIKDPMLYQKALEDLAKRAKRAQARVALIILEFSRRNYAAALNVLAQRGVYPDLIVYLDVDLETAIHRNRQRVKAGRLDRHYVSEREMRTTFGSDDLEQLKQTYSGRILVLTEPAERHEPETVRRHALQILERLKV
jgi:thymidylate kinase